MRITAVDTFIMWGEPRNWVFVKISTDEPELYGWGEATLEGKDATVRTCIGQLGELLIGKDPLETERLWQSVISYWPDHAPRRATKLLHRRLSRLPCTTIDALRGAVGDWLQDGFPNAASDDKALAYDVFDHLVGCLLAAGSADSAATENVAIGKQTIRGEPIPSRGAPERGGKRKPRPPSEP